MTAGETAAPEPGAARRELRAVRALLPYLWPKDAGDLKVRVVVALALLAAAKLVNVYVPILYKRAVDALTGTADTAFGASGAYTGIVAVPLALLVAYGVARMVSAAFAELRDAVFAKVAQRAIRTVALRVFRHIHGLSLAYHLERQTGGLSRAIERGTKGIEFLLTFMLLNVLPTFIEIALVCGILWSLYGARYALVTFVTIAAYIAFTLLVTEWRLKYRREMNAMDSEANSKAIDSLLNYETVKYFGNEEHEARRYDAALARFERAAVASRSSLSLLNVGQGAIIALGLTGLMVMAAQGVADARMTIGDFVLVNSYLVQLYLPLNFLGFVYREIKNALTDMDAMFALLGVGSQIRDRADAVPLEASGGEIAFDRVSFAYDPRRPILKDVSFRVPAGRMVAVVGPSGAGKSTISRLLFRFYDAGSGAVRIDGQDVREVTQASLRAAIGIVPQDTVLFNDTILYNVAYGRPGAPREEIERAARLAHIHDFVLSLPGGYDATVGERGLKLSGGEKQRVAIARMLLKGPKILLFDEATSALDSKTEKEIQANLREVAAGHTTLVIAHRLSTVVDADEILVLEDGRIVERGRHVELLAKDGAYAAMWRRQQEVAEGKEQPGENGEALREAPREAPREVPVPRAVPDTAP